MARKPSISESLRSSLSSDLATPGYSGPSRSSRGAKAGLAMGKRVAEDAYGDFGVSTENRAGWLATISDTFSNVIFGGDEEETTTASETPASTYDEIPVDATAYREPVALTGNFDYNAVADVPAMNDSQFTESAEQVAANLSIPVHWMYAVMDVESGFDPAVRNQEYVNQGREDDAAIGLIQFMPRTARDLGTSVDELKNMSMTEQLTYVERFYEQWAGRINSPEDLYVATFYPAALGRDDDFVLGSQEENPEAAIAGVVSGNSKLDSNNDGRITLGEVKAFYRNSPGYNRFIRPFEMPSN